MQLILGVTEYVYEWKDRTVIADHDPPVLRSLRVIRNSVAHRNEITYANADPRPNTAWRGFEFTENIDGHQLFSQLDEFTWQSEEAEIIGGYFEAGDAYVLVGDVLRILVDESNVYDERDVVDIGGDAFL